MLPKKMRRWGAWLRFFGNDAVAVWKRAESRLKFGHANVLLMIRTGLYRLPTFCGWGVGVSQRRTNPWQGSFTYAYYRLLGRTRPGYFSLRESH